jgi:hypothetical protein
MKKYLDCSIALVSLWLRATPEYFHQAIYGLDQTSRISLFLKPRLLSQIVLDKLISKAYYA